MKKEMWDLIKIHNNLNDLLNEFKREILDYNHRFWILTCLYVYVVWKPWFSRQANQAWGVFFLAATKSVLFF